jgi:hypothetical protein
LALNPRYRKPGNRPVGWGEGDIDQGAEIVVM